MSSNIKLWCFILLLPVFGAIGHDIFANFYQNDENRAKIEAGQIDALPTDPNAYKASDFGYLLVTYVPTLYENSKAVVNDVTWRRWVDPFLSLYTIVVAAIPAAMFFVWLLISRIFDVWPFVNEGKVARKRGNKSYMQDDPLDKRSREQTFKYKRK